MKNLGIYVHIPFCKSRCIYCDFASCVHGEEAQNKYTDFLVQEIKQAKQNFCLDNLVVDSIYFGGGTPSVLSLNNFEKIITTIKAVFFCQLKEFTIEANPNSLNQQCLDFYKKCGVDRISIGVQTLNDEILHKIGRLHSSKQAQQTLNLCIGNNIKTSVDMMIGLPNQKMHDIKIFVDTFAELGVNHISAYSLKLEDNTPLARMVETKEIILPDEDTCIDMYEYAYEILQKYNYNRYEISNFALGENRCYHNLKYWNCEDYLGFGLSAHSLFKKNRFYNSSDFDKYFKGVLAYDNYIQEQCLTTEDIIAEKIMLALRMEKGLNINEINMAFDMDFERVYQKAISKNLNYIILENGHLRIKKQYFNVMNSIIIDFIF